MDTICGEIAGYAAGEAAVGAGAVVGSAALRIQNNKTRRRCGFTRRATLSDFLWWGTMELFCCGAEPGDRTVHAK